MRKLALALALLALTACRVPGGTDGFAVNEADSRSYAAADTSLLSVTVKGMIHQPHGRQRRLTVAAVDPMQTLASAVAEPGSYQLTIPDPTTSDKTKPFNRFIQDDDKTPENYAVFDRWELVIFDDKNGNGVFDRRGVPQLEIDTALAPTIKYRLIFKSYTRQNASHLFLPFNDFEQGWIIARVYAYRQRSFHQDFSQDFDFELSD